MHFYVSTQNISYRENSSCICIEGKGLCSFHQSLGEMREELFLNIGSALIFLAIIFRNFSYQTWDQLQVPLLWLCFAPLDSVSHTILNLSLHSIVFVFFFQSLTGYRFSAVNNRSEGLDLEDCFSSLFFFASIFSFDCYQKETDLSLIHDQLIFSSCFSQPDTEQNKHCSQNLTEKGRKEFSFHCLLLYCYHVGEKHLKVPVSAEHQEIIGILKSHCQILPIGVSCSSVVCVLESY